VRQQLANDGFESSELRLGGLLVFDAEADHELRNRELIDMFKQRGHYLLLRFSLHVAALERLELGAAHDTVEFVEQRDLIRKARIAIHEDLVRHRFLQQRQKLLVFGLADDLEQLAKVVVGFELSAQLGDTDLNEGIMPQCRVQLAVTEDFDLLGRAEQREIERRIGGRDLQRPGLEYFLRGGSSRAGRQQHDGRKETDE